MTSTTILILAAAALASAVLAARGRRPEPRRVRIETARGRRDPR